MFLGILLIGNGLKFFPLTARYNALGVANRVVVRSRTGTPNCSLISGSFGHIPTLLAVGGFQQRPFGRGGVVAVILLVLGGIPGSSALTSTKPPPTPV